MANSIAFAAPLPSSAGEVMWYASQVAPYPTTSARILAPLACACSKDSNTTIPAPSPITKPFLSWSNGIDAFFTSSVVFNAVKEVKPATPIGVILASVPPATITSASPCWMERNASPMEWVPVAHAVTTLMHFPLRPNWIETFPAAMLLIIKGTNNGSTLPGPFSNSLFSLRSKACKEPIPDPTLTPTRKGSSFSMSMPDVSRASFAAATANWQNVSIRRAVFGSIYCFGSKSFTSAASLHLKSAVSK